MINFLHPKSLTRPWLMGTAIALFMGSVGTYLIVSQIQGNDPSPETTTVVSAPQTVTALGRIEPQGEVIKLSVANAQDSRVNQLKVEEGEWVEAGQMIAILQGLDQKQAELAQAQQNVKIYQARLAQVEAGEAKLAEIAAQEAVINQLKAQLRTETREREAEIASVQAELRNAKQNYQRYQMLHQEGAVDTAARDDRRETFETTQAALQEAQAHLETTRLTLQERIRQEEALLKTLKEVRPVDREEAQAELAHAIAQVKRIESELEDFYVRVPIAGQILKINTRVGEQVNTSEGIVELGQTNQMYAIAEVYETDVNLVQPGQRVTIVSEYGGFTGEIHGTVDQVGRQIKKQDVIDADPAADQDARVVEVEVRIDPEDNEKVAGLTNLQVRITIDVENE
ncbi:MAG: HlyD family efflux transporter periplasmic adaptor subunit [Cyanobacteria bacterium]|jgi:HlyD family secretion protein|nr:HlyD family efflux transporter periplasmic adaptor subunit [Cyanobacteria bacterium GSL.Bin1]